MTAASTSGRHWRLGTWSRVRALARSRRKRRALDPPEILEIDMSRRSGWLRCSVLRMSRSARRAVRMPSDPRGSAKSMFGKRCSARFLPGRDSGFFSLDAASVWSPPPGLRSRPFPYRLAADSCSERRPTGGSASSLAACPWQVRIGARLQWPRYGLTGPIEACRWAAFARRVPRPIRPSLFAAASVLGRSRIAATSVTGPAATPASRGRDSRGVPDRRRRPCFARAANRSCSSCVAWTSRPRGL